MSTPVSSSALTMTAMSTTAQIPLVLLNGYFECLTPAHISFDVCVYVLGTCVLMQLLFVFL